MTKPTTRASIQNHYRSRSPKRRKTNTPGRRSSTAPDYRDISSSSEEGQQYSVRAIIGEHKFGTETKYLLDWEPDPKTGETYEPSWEPAGNLGSWLLPDWEARKQTNGRKEEDGVGTSKLSHQVESSLADEVRNRSKPNLRSRGTRKVIPDSSSDTENEQRDTDPDRLSVPALASTCASTPANEYDSPPAEILETQQAHSAEHRDFSINIPAIDFDQLGYEHQYSPDSQLQAFASIETSSHSLQTPPWEFQSQFSLSKDAVSHSNGTPGPRTKKGPHSQTINSHENHTIEFQSQSSFSKHAANHSSRTPYPQAVRKMDVPVVRQSPRLRAATPVGAPKSPRPSTREVVRARSPLKDDGREPVTSPLARSQPQNAEYGSTLSPASAAEPQVRQTQTQSYIPALAYPQDSSSSYVPQPSTYDSSGIGTFPIHQSIEDEPSSSVDEPDSIESKASSSQQSLQNEREVPQVDGISLPLQPVLGPAEYTIALPAEGKIQSAYVDTINAKKKTLLKFVHRPGSVGSGSGSPRRTIERNEMIELMERLHDTTTHFDLGLPGFATQYSIRSDEAITYAQYAGSKFVFLGNLVDTLARVDCGIVIASKPGPIQDLLYDFLKMKQVRVQRHDRPGSARSVTPDIHQATLKVDLVSTSSDIEIQLTHRPILIIAFDYSFDNQSPQIRRIRELNSRGRDQLLPILHLLVTNSSEHVDRCLRKAMPSPQRLKLLVRATYQARSNLGGTLTYVPHPADEPEGRPMDLHELQRAVRKSPNRKLSMIAAVVARVALSEDFDQYWSLGTMPDLQYEDLDDTPPKMSRVATGVNTASGTPRDARARSRTPISRAGTPSGRKRMLDVENPANMLAKRQRLTPMHDTTPVPELPQQQEVHQLREQLKAAQTELATEKAARIKAEESLEYTRKRLEEWTKSHADMLHRYEKRRDQIRKIDKENKKLKSTLEARKLQIERGMDGNERLKEQVKELKTELETARSDLKKEGGDVASLEEAREEARSAKEKAASAEKSLGNTKRDFEFTRQQYQEASNKAAELASTNADLEEQVEKLKGLASDEKRKLREMNMVAVQQRDQDQIDKLELEKRGMTVMIRKMEDEIKALKKGRTGVQTRGSSVQPPGSPGVVHGTRSRQGSPAPGTVLSASRDAREALHGHQHGPPGGRDPVNRLRNER